MASATTHEKLLCELRKRCAGEPKIEQATIQKQADALGLSLPQRFDILLPLIKAAWWCAAFRSLAVVFLGLGLTITVALRWCNAGTSSTTLVLGFVASLSFLCFGLRGVPGGFPFMEVKTKAGFYSNEAGECSARNLRFREAFETWKLGVGQCPYLLSGELCTLLPFLWNPNRGGSLRYERIWSKMSDGEHVASDWVFPPSGHDPAQPVVLLLTGLAPAEHWTKTGGFIADTVYHLSIRRGMTVVVLVARGTMDTAVKEHLFHGARVTDLREVVVMVDAALGVVSEAGLRPPVFAAGFSMGGIILANYCGQYGSDARLHGAVQFSGLFDAAFNMKFEYSKKTWQAYLAYGLKTTFLNDDLVAKAAKKGVNTERVLSRHVGSVCDFDDEFVAPFNGYDGMLDYYRDMSLGAEEKWKKVAVPLLAIAARDDPITHCDALKAGDFSAGNQHLLFLITDVGGHVGWPLGWKPWTRGFDFMSEAIEVFIRSALADG